MKARFSKHYRITPEELDWLATQIEELGPVVHLVGQERIAALKNSVAP